jgi:hypothetical protein
MKRVNSKQAESTRRVGWLLGPVMVSYGSDESGDEARFQARDLATAGAVEVESWAMEGGLSSNAANLAAANGSGLVVLPGSMVVSAEGQQRMRESLATACPVLVARSRLGGPVMVLADTMRTGLGAMAVAADEARRLDRPLLVVHAGEGNGNPKNDEMRPISAMSLRVCLDTIRLRWGVAVENRSIAGPCASSLTLLARALAARLIVLRAYDGSGVEDTSRTQRMLEIASVAPCSVLLLPPPSDEKQWRDERPAPLASLRRPRNSSNVSIPAEGGVQ